MRRRSFDRCHRNRVPPESSPAATGMAAAKGPAHAVPNTGAESSTSAPVAQTLAKPSFVARCAPPPDFA